MYKVGVWPGKLSPPTRGHINAILQAGTQCEKLYVVVSHNEKLEHQLYNNTSIKPITLKQKTKWLSVELSEFEHIKIVMLDESDFPIYPYGWEQWAKKLNEVVGEPFNVIFGGEPAYAEDGYTKYFPNVVYEIYDPSRTEYPISATKIRENPYKYWDYILGSAREHFVKKVLIAGSESCVDGDTQFFNGYEWKNIRDYNNDMVLQYDNNGIATLVKPYKYIKEPTNKLYKLQNSYGNWSQVYSEDHDIVYITSKGNLSKKPFKELYNQHLNNKCGFQGKLINHFQYDGDINVEEHKLRLMIAISADGTKCKNQWRIRLKKERKIARLRELIKNVGLELDERIYEDEYSNFYVPNEYGIKIFDKKIFMRLNKKSQLIFIDEIFKWDGTKESEYFTTEKNNMEVVQFILSSNNFKCQIYIDNRDTKQYKTCYRVVKSSVPYTDISINDKFNGQHRTNMITEFIPNDGYKYCFTVPSGMLVLRRDNHIFITGNCGKSTLTKMLAKIFFTSWAREEGRYYSTKYFGGNENVFELDDFYNICWEQRQIEDHAIRSANKITFFDTDAVITQYYCNLYLGEMNPNIETLINPDRYDIVLFMKPDVKWVADGFRWNSEDNLRWKLHEQLKQMYLDRGFGDKIVEIGGNYNERLNTAIDISKKLIAISE